MNLRSYWVATMAAVFASVASAQCEFTKAETVGETMVPVGGRKCGGLSFTWHGASIDTTSAQGCPLLIQHTP